MSVTTFEDLVCWQLARKLTRHVYDLTENAKFSRDWELRKQIRKAAVSTMSNIAEGFERDGNKEFLQFLSIAKGSSGEIRAQLYVAKDREYISENDFRSVSDAAIELSKTISGLIRYLKGSSKKGRKHR